MHCASGRGGYGNRKLAAALVNQQQAPFTVFGVLCRIDIQATLREELGVEFPRYAIPDVCNPLLAIRHWRTSSILDSCCRAMPWSMRRRGGVGRDCRRRKDAVGPWEPRNAFDGRRSKPEATSRRGRLATSLSGMKPLRAILTPWRLRCGFGILLRSVLVVKGASLPLGCPRPTSLPTLQKGGLSALIGKCVSDAVDPTPFRDHNAAPRCSWSA